jgi:nitroimidazol reductase NimA-like FMN-containing flavoprotein (pyridoxamine 5'-phosphate oxidase superfamily)
VRERQRGAHDRATIDAILDAGLVCHLGFVHRGAPVVIPTLHARVADELLIHGSSASRALHSARGALPVCATVTLLDGLVLARSVFEHSVNYRSVMVFGHARAIESPREKLEALRALTEQLLPGRWADARPPDRRELKATAILALPISEVSAKLRSGPPGDGDGPDAALATWAGEIPLGVVAAKPVPDPLLDPSVQPPAYVSNYARPGLVYDRSVLGDDLGASSGADGG